VRRARWLAIVGGVCALLIALARAPGVTRATGQARTGRAAPGPPAAAEVTVSEGTSMSVAASPDGRSLAIDLQGSLWIVPAAGGAARRITDIFDDAHQPEWAPDGKSIAFFAYTDGGYDIWTIAPDGGNRRKLTAGPFDDREPVWSHDGSRVAFSSDRGDPLGSDYNIWIVDVRTGELRQLTRNRADDYMPSWSPDDKEIAFASTRGGVWAVAVGDGTERQLTAAGSRVDAPSWGPGGQIVYYSARDGSSLESDGKRLTGDENAAPFRVSWASPSEFYYVGDGRIRRRTIDGGAARTIAFTATLPIARVNYPRRKRDFGATAPRQVLGVVSPVISPDGTRIAFAALNDIYVMPVGGKPVNITHDGAFDTDPAWSPDGRQLAYSSDKGGNQLQLWIRDMQSGQSHQVTHLTTQPTGAAWAPDGKRIAFLNITNNYGVAEVAVLDVATSRVQKVHGSLPQPGHPAWSADGSRLAMAAIAPFSRRYREGTNQVLTVSTTPGGGDQWYAPAATVSIDSRADCGPVWSPDGTKMAAIYEGVLSVWPVAPSGEPIGPPRRFTTEPANTPTWQGDSRHVLYQSHDKLKIVDVATGEVRQVPVDLHYTMDVPKGRVVVHAGRLIDMTGPTAKTNVDIVVEGNRIKSVETHTAAQHAGARVVDASNLTAMPGLIDWHTHLQAMYGESQGREYLAFGITTVQSLGGAPYEAVEEREAVDANARVGPRVFSTGYLLEYRRVYYRMGIALSSPAQLEMELQRAKALRYDLLKSYVRLPDPQQKRVVEFAHGLGIPVTTHEIYPASAVGVDATEHFASTSRRGYSMKQGPLNRAYEDFYLLIGRSGRVFDATLGEDDYGTSKLFADDPALKDDPRFKLSPAFLQKQVEELNARGLEQRGKPVTLPITLRGNGRMVLDAMHAGATIVGGTDRPLPIKVHGDAVSSVLIGLSPYEALKILTVNTARALALDAGTIEPGKLADIVIVDGNPLEDVAAAHRVKRVVANGRVYELDELLKGVRARSTPTAASSGAR
jgi:Tol biopolymer transport system component/cytosine/adenosine deaminase-related metal-dependent hydrolase